MALQPPAFGSGVVFSFHTFPKLEDHSAVSFGGQVIRADGEKVSDIVPGFKRPSRNKTERAAATNTGGA
jgi:hypothetical protein